LTAIFVNTFAIDWDVPQSSMQLMTCMLTFS